MKAYTIKSSFLCGPRRIVRQQGRNQRVVLVPGRPINNRPQVNNLPYIAAKAHCDRVAGPKRCATQ
jgi:hypothetical protein